MEIRFLCVGRLKESYYLDAQKEYLKRLGAFARVEVLEVKEELRSAGITGETALSRERDAIRRLIPAGAKVAALCIEGREMDSPALARELGKLTGDGGAKLCILIGGSEGLHPELKKEADLRLSMSPMTFPHHLARIMALEQLYRAFDILRGGKYHK